MFDDIIDDVDLIPQEIWKFTIQDDDGYTDENASCLRRYIDWLKIKYGYSDKEGFQYIVGKGLNEVDREKLDDDSEED